MVIESIIGLVTAFILISAILLWILIKTRINIFVKFLMISVVLWYGVVLLSIPINFMGWPKQMVGSKYSGKFIKDYLVVEPTKEKEGNIYFWLIDNVKVEERLISKARPDKIFLIKWNGVPRAYSIKYSKDLHKRLIEASRKKRKNFGSFIKIEGRERPGNGNKLLSIKKLKFKVINPSETHTKNG